MSNINFNYVNCKKEDFAKEVSFQESDFIEILNGCFEAHAGLQETNVNFHLDPNNNVDIFTCSIDLFFQKQKKFHLEIAGDKQFSNLVTSLCHKAVNLARKQADKLQDHRK